MSLQTDATWFADLGGKHEFKAGVQYDVVKNDVLDGETGNLIRIYWGTTLAPNIAGPNRGAYGYYRVRTNAFEPEPRLPDRRRHPEQQPRPVPPGLLDDRPEADPEPRPPHGARDGPNYDPERSRGHRARLRRGRSSTSSFGEKLAPRIGFAYDVKGDGKTKVYGSWGLFYDIFKLALPRGSFGGDKWIDVYYTLDTPNPADLVSLRGELRRDLRRQLPGHARCGRRSTSASRRSTTSSTTPTATPVLDPYRLQEFSGGIEHSLTNNSSGRAALRPQADRQGDRGHRLPGRAGQRGRT